MRRLLAVFALVASPTLADPTDPSVPAPTKMSAEAMANDPRMIAALRHANAVADKKCGDGPGGAIVMLSEKAAARACRRRILATARLDAEGEIEGH